MVSMYGVQHLEYCFWKELFFHTGHSFYVWSTTFRVCSGKEKNSYPEQFLCMSYDILSIVFRKEKNLLPFPLSNIV